MTNRDVPDRGGQDGEQDRERLIGTQCRVCGRSIGYVATDRPPLYCSAGCRQGAWASRAAEQMERDEPGPDVTHEVAREQTQASCPRHPEQWAQQLIVLSAQLNDPDSAVANDTRYHQRLAYTLTHALAALDAVSGGGIAWDRLPARVEPPTS